MDTLFAICATYEVDDGQAAGFMLMRKQLDGGAKPWPILITRKGNSFFGFENACPHQGLRLDAVPGEFMDEDGNFITCGNHHAQFDLDTRPASCGTSVMPAMRARWMSLLVTVISPKLNQLISRAAVLCDRDFESRRLVCRRLVERRFLAGEAEPSGAV
ncbi:MAG TPA: Rieske 2Fe-2S domain-containing protein [Bradyrhizobium sp.]|nr:Rieske 2Fe-2S domain-containing protein [Bradyrhizobium sp.]